MHVKAEMVLILDISIVKQYVDNWQRSLTHWGRDKMDAITQAPFSNGFSWMKMYEDQATSHYLNQWWLDYWRIYASLGLNEFKTL